MQTINYKDVFNFSLTQNIQFTSSGLPIIHGTNYIPTHLKPFNYMLNSTNNNFGIHFYIDDYQFERIWNNPIRYTKLLKNYDCVIGPDFSLYKNLPKPIQIYNLYRQRLLTAYWQNLGIKVIPNLTWSDEESLKITLDGMPKYSVIALSTNGCLKNKKTKNEFLKCFNKAINYLKPIKMLVIGNIPIELQSNDKIIQYDNYSKHFENLHKGDIINGRKKF